MNECLVCTGQPEERRITRLQEYNGQWYMIENLPALCAAIETIRADIDPHG